MSTQMLNDQTFAPATAGRATPAAAGRMTVAGTALKALVLIAVTLVFAGIGWNRAVEVLDTASGIWFLLWFFVLIALTIATAQNPRLALPLGLLYAVLMGLWIGAISRVYEAWSDGIVAQALFATVGTFIACLALYATGVVKVSGRFVKIVAGATLGILLYYVVALILSLFGVDILLIDEPSPAGIILSVVICLVAAANLFIDFAVIDQGVERGAPATMEWYAAFGLLSTLIWLYVEILRLLSLLRQRQ